MEFDTLGLPARVAKNLTELGITTPSPIQARAIPVAMNGRDVMGLAQTGTGKTAAFGLPIITECLRIEGRVPPKSVRGLILAPTRELARQIQEALQGFAKGTALRVALVVGGASINAQIKRLERGTDILVATPGRLIDLLDRKAVTLMDAQFLVLDEADQMLDLGFIHALRKIAPLLRKERQTMLFSATMPKHMNELASTYLQNPERIQVAAPGKPADKITQSIYFMAQSEKTQILIQHLGKHKEDPAIVFSRTKHGAERMMKALAKAGFKVGAVHGNKSQGQRDRVIRDFKEGELTVLVATDVAARGIDIPTVRYVYNYDLPNVPDNYVHRIGRTARAGRDGTAVAFCAPDELSYLKGIEKVMGKEIPVAGPASWATAAKIDAQEENSGGFKKRGRPQRGGNKGGGHGGQRRGAPKGDGNTEAFFEKPAGGRGGKPRAGGSSAAKTEGKPAGRPRTRGPGPSKGGAGKGGNGPARRSA